MTVDVIIPSYNSIATLNKAIASVAMQTLDEGDHLRLVLVDDCSTDGIDYAQIIEYWSFQLDCELIPKQVNEGCGRARQTGLDETDSDFVMFLDADDTLVGPHAVRYLLRAIGDNDVCMGQFVEENEDGATLHQENWTWCHGKLYRRRFIDKHLIRFNETRYNEDSGFNQIISHITDRAIYIPQIVYSWNNNKYSTVRSNRDAYRCGYGWRDFIENLAYACEELEKRNINKAVIRDFAVQCACALYNQYCDTLAILPEDKEENVKKLKEFYKRTLRKYVLMGAVQWEHFAASYLEVNKITPSEGIHQITFKEYIKTLGFYEDQAKLMRSI